MLGIAEKVITAKEDKVVRHYLLILALVGGIGAMSAPAEAGCNTGKPNCSGTKTFTGTAEQRCFRVYLGNANQELDFCLRRGESHPVKVQSGDTYCAWERNDPLPKDCKQMWIDTN